MTWGTMMEKTSEIVPVESEYFYGVHVFYIVFRNNVAKKYVYNTAAFKNCHYDKTLDEEESRKDTFLLMTVMPRSYSSSH